jgi:hypothetical protein
MAQDKRDERTFIKVHDGIEDHPKIAPLSDKAFRLLVTTWAWCSKHLTDGRVPIAIWKRRGTKAARAELVAAGMVDPHDGHVEMHDYLQHQRSAAEVEENRVVRRRSSLLANHTRHHVNKRVFQEDCELCLEQTPPTPPEDDRNGLPNGSEHPSDSEADSESEFGNESNNSAAFSSKTAGISTRKHPVDGTRAVGATSENAPGRLSESDPNTPPKSSIEVEVDIEEETHLGTKASSTSTRDETRRGARGPTAAEAHRLVRRVIGLDFPGAVLTDLAIRSAELLQQYDQDTLVEALTEWRERTGIGPGVLPSLVADVVKRRNGTTQARDRPYVSQTDTNIAAFLGGGNGTQPQLRAITGGTA